MESPKTLLMNVSALIFSSIPEINEILQMLVLLLSVAISIWQLKRMNDNE